MTARREKGVLEKQISAIHRAKFTVVFYSLGIFPRKATQFCITCCEW
jgi:hypothetical protein